MFCPHFNKQFVYRRAFHILELKSEVTGGHWIVAERRTREILVWTEEDLVTVFQELR